MAEYKLGIDFPPEDQAFILQRCTNRFTGEHTPQWVHFARKYGKDYHCYYVTDQDWLESTAFKSRKDGRLDRRMPRFVGRHYDMPPDPQQPLRDSK